MNKLKLLLFLTSFHTFFCVAQPEPIQIVLFGTYHLSAATSDPVKVARDSILGPKRQQEIEQIVTQLAKFDPQHIFIEATEKWDSVFQRAYQLHQQGKLPKRRWIAESETFQFGIKTAHRIGLEQGVTLVDWQPPNTADTARRLQDPVQEAYRQYLKAVRQAAHDRNFSAKNIPSVVYEALSEAHAKFMDSVPNLPLKESILRFNSEEKRRFLYHANILRYMDNNPADIGVEWTHTQNFRNLNIYRNILKHITEDTSRCLVIFGAGHIQALREFFKNNPRFEIVEVAEILD